MHIVWGIMAGKYKCGKMGDHQKKEIFINNSVAVLISFNEGHQGLLKLHVPFFGMEEKWGYLRKRLF